MALAVEFPVFLLHRKLGPGAVLTEPLFVSAYSRLANRVETAAAVVHRLLSDYFADADPGELIRHRRAVAARSHSFTVSVSPPRKNDAWREPVELTLHAAVWEHDGGHVLARVPALGIELVVTPKDDLDAVLKRECLTALRRANATAGLQRLGSLPLGSAFRIDDTAVTASIPTLKERAVRGQTEGEPKKTALQVVGTLLNPATQEPAFEIDATVKEIADALTARPAQSVLLVGPSGVGKTAAVRELVRRKAEFGLTDPPFFQTSGSRIVAGQCGFGMWEQRCQDLVKDAVKRRAVVALGQLVELLNVGKSEHNPTGIATFLRPSVARGDLLCIAECTPEQVPLIEKEDPQLLDAFRRVNVDEPDPARGLTMLTAFAAAGRRRRRPTSPDALTAVDRLHRRYATYSAYPGRPMRFLDNLIRDGVGEPVRVGDVYEAFTRETGLPKPLVDPAVPLDVPATRDWFAGRVIGQTEAVDLVTDLLATVKAGLTRPNRPIASLLFIGPTGVGKTEMAKALAEFLFGSKDRLTRFDMSEYADPVSVRRLVGGAFGREGLLTAKVREQPFGVLLLDEIEKADPSVFDLLLQALGEARLTDGGGRLADFRNTVVILTSNLGADTFRGSRPGFGNTAGTDATGHFARAVERFFRPELVNRLDRVVPFAPLPPEVVRRIAAREWRKVLARDGVRFRPLTLRAADGLTEHLTAVGFDPRYGARPLKRALERELLAPLARDLNRHSGDTPLTADVGVTGGRPAVSVKPIPGAKPRTRREPNTPDGRVVADIQTHRRLHQLLEQSSVVRDLDNQITQLRYQERWVRKRLAKGQPLTREQQRVLAELGRLRELDGTIRRQRAEAEARETDAVTAFLEDNAPAVLGLREPHDEAVREWDELLLTLYARIAPTATRVTLALFGENRRRLIELAAAYRTLAGQASIDVMAVGYVLPDDPQQFPVGQKPPEASNPKVPMYWHDDHLMVKEPRLTAAFVREPMLTDLEFADPPEGLIGIGLSFVGRGAHLRFGTELGLHYFAATPDDPAEPLVYVAASTADLGAYKPNPEYARKGSLPPGSPRRTYTADAVIDIGFEEPFVNLRGSFVERLAVVVNAGVRRRLLAMVTE